MPVETSRLVDELTLINRKRTRALELIEAVSEPPVMTMTMDGANTLEVTVADADRKLLRSPATGERSWAQVDGIRFELVAMSKTEDRFTLTFEDGIAAALRRRTKPLSVPAGSTTRREFAIRLAREARVPYRIDDTKRPPVARVLERSASGEKSTSWDVLGEMAEDVRWRRFSDGKRLIIGSDDWLFDRDKNPNVLREYRNGVQSIDFDLDVAKRASTATLTVDAKLWSLGPGSVCRLNEEMGPADGKWLVSEFTRPLTSTRATVTLVRAQHALKEPKPQGPGERGEPDFVPGADNGTPSGGAAGTPGREKFVTFALAQKGKPYVWGASGPNAYDCSGLVQAASAHAGRFLAKPSSSQWAAVARAGRTMSIDAAIRTRGALLFRIGVSEYNHVAISLGNGSTIEAMGSAYGVCIGNAGGRGWTGAGLWL